MTLTETLHAASFIVSEEENFYSRDAVVVDASNALVPGTVLGKKGVAAQETATAVAAAGNTGNGAITMDGTAPVAPQALDGVYEVIMRGAGATAPFEVIGPNGISDGVGAVGTTYNGAIKFAIAAGGTAFVLDDRFLVTVSRPDTVADQYEPVNFSGTDGTQKAAAILVYGIDSDEAVANTTVQRTVLRRQSQVRASDLTWPAGATVAQIAEATNQLRAIGIIPR